MNFETLEFGAERREREEEGGRRARDEGRSLITSDTKTKTVFVFFFFLWILKGFQIQTRLIHDLEGIVVWAFRNEPWELITIFSSPFDFFKKNSKFTQFYYYHHQALLAIRIFSSWPTSG